MSNAEWIWMNGKLVAREDARIHVGSTALHFGPVVFEGIRCYGAGATHLRFFRLNAHIDRLFASARAMHLEILFSKAEIAQACADTVIANAHSDAYVRPLVLPGTNALGFGRRGAPAELFILSFPWDNTHLERSQHRGIRIHIASVIRTEAHASMSKAKVSANYAAGLLAIHEARAAGCDDALLLDRKGIVAEASTANVFAVWRGKLVTPPGRLPILPGIMRDSVITLADSLGIDVTEDIFEVEDLASADEIFLSGTTAELTPVRELSGQKVNGGTPGHITTQLLAALKDQVRGEGADRGWLQPLNG